MKIVKKISALLVLSSLFLSGCNSNAYNGLMMVINGINSVTQQNDNNEEDPKPVEEEPEEEELPEDYDGSILSIEYRETYQLKVGYSVTIPYTIKPSVATKTEVEFSSSDSTIVSVNQEGKLTAKKAGTAYITVSSKENPQISATCEVTAFTEAVAVTGVSLNRTSLQLEQNDTFQLVATVSPSNATNKKVTYQSMDENVATVSKDGVITALSVGEAQILAITEEGNFTARCNLTVVEEVVVVKATSISLSDSSKNLYVGDTYALTATVLPENTTNPEVTWKTSNTNVAAVNVTTGVVTAKAAGSATITATTKDGTNLSATCTIKVTKPTVYVTGVSLSKTSLEVATGRTATLTATVSPSNATDTSLTWSTSNSSVATVNAGSVKGIAPGSAVITATTNDGGYTASCNVTVTEATGDDFTVLIYMCGADLESNSSQRLATSDLTEILSVAGQPDDVNIVIETGGASSWASDYGVDASKLERWHVENKQLKRDASLTYASMGLSSTLQSFLEYGLDNYPADRTGLILWNHGGAMTGVCFDENKGDDSLLNTEVASAVKNALKNTGHEGEKLEFIGYDACLMQLQDIAITNSPYFNYMIASEESEAGEGWDYDTWVDDLYAHKDTETILTTICDGFIADNGGSSSRNDQTLSYLDLAYASEYKTAWESMAGALKNKVSSSNSDSFNSLVETCKTYTEDGSSNYYYGMIDAKDFLNKLTDDKTFAPATTYTDAVNTAFSHLVKYSKKGGGAGNSNGLCMYWGQNSQAKSYYSSTYTELTNWLYLVNNYGYDVQGGGSGGWWY